MHGSSDVNVTVVIPNWNGIRWLPGCLEGLAAQTYRDFRVIMVDGGSTDESVPYVEAEYPDVETLDQVHNHGFSHAVNAGIRASRTRYVALLNNDTVPQPGWLGALVAALDRAPPDVGSVASCMLSMRDPHTVDDAGDLLTWHGMAGKRGHGEPASAFAEEVDVFSACAGAALYRASFLADVGGFDERFFAYLEDVDLGLRGHLRGWRCLYAPEAKVLHYGQGSGMPRARYVRLMTRNRLLLFAKHVPARLLLTKSHKLLYGQLFFLLAYRRPLASLAGYLAFVRDIPHVIRERRRILPLRRIGNRDLACRLLDAPTEPSLRRQLAYGVRTLFRSLRRLLSGIRGRGRRSRRGMLGVLRRQNGHLPPTLERDTYARWVARYDTLDRERIAKLRSDAEAFAYRPLISIITPVFEASRAVFELTVASVLRQTYANWEWCVADDGSSDSNLLAYLRRLSREDRRIKVCFRSRRGHISAASNTALELAGGEFVALLDHDDLLAPHALSEVVAALNRNRSLDLVYTDEDKIDARGRRMEPHLKSDWNLDLLYSQNCVSHLGVYRRALVCALGGFRRGYEGGQDYDLVLRFAERTPPTRIHHIPKILYHWRAGTSSTARTPTAKSYADVARQRALRDHFARIEERADILSVPGCQHHRIRWHLSESPSVSVVIPTRDRLASLRPCLEGVLHRTDYPHLDVLVVDNDSTDPATLAYLDQMSSDPRVRVLPIPGPFNFSKLNNVAVGRAHSDVILFLNNDIEVCDPSWLREMVSYLGRPEVAAVGARLLYPNQTVQHAGVVVGLGGVAGHLYKGWDRRALGHKGRAQLAQNVSAVTAACMLVRKNVFDEVGGFDEEHLAVAFNDVDLCLKIRALGHLIVWTPYATLIHHESTSRGSDQTPQNAARFAREVAFMQRKWNTRDYRDPYFNPNLSLQHTDLALATPPRFAEP